MPEPVCLCCLNTVEADQMVIQNSHDIYHLDCLEKLSNLKNRRNEELLDVTDSLVIDASDSPINFNFKNQDYKCGKYIDLTTNEKILDDYNYYNNKKYDLIKKIIDGPEYAQDIAGNLVKLDKPYLINYELGKISSD